MAIQPSFSLENRTCTWKCGHGRHWYVRKKPLGVDIWGYVKAFILLFLFIMQTLKFFTLFVFDYFLFIYMFPFCLHATIALYKLITIFFCIIKCFWIFDMFLKFLYVLDVNKTKFYCNIWFYLIVKRLLLWFLLRSGIICLSIVSLIWSWFLRVMILLRKWRVILVFYCLVFYCVILVCSVCLYFVSFIIFVTEVFERTSGEDSP